jgi:hypothetical protein
MKGPGIGRRPKNSFEKDFLALPYYPFIETYQLDMKWHTFTQETLSECLPCARNCCKQFPNVNSLILLAVTFILIVISNGTL